MIQRLYHQYDTVYWQVFNGKFEERNINKQRFLLEKSLKRQLKNLGLVWIRYKMDHEQIHCNDVLHSGISEQHVLKTFTLYIICYFYNF
jgi:hypothetical protein